MLLSQEAEGSVSASCLSEVQEAFPLEEPDYEIGATPVRRSR